MINAPKNFLNFCWAVEWFMFITYSIVHYLTENNQYSEDVQGTIYIKASVKRKKNLLNNIDRDYGERYGEI